MHAIRPVEPLTADAVDLLTPAQVRQEHPLSDAGRRTVERARAEAAAILRGEDDRLLAVVGPCSVHDHDAALDYARRLAQVAADSAGEILVVMRTYVEKPRTRLGWKGMVYDPDLDGSCDLNRGLLASRRLMTEVVELGLPVACEFLDPLIAGYLDDVVSWGAIGARTVQSQIHRQLASGLGMPIGMKNATNGSVEEAVDAIVAAAHAHTFPGIGAHGQAALVATAGNPDCHVVLRGGSDGPNYGSLDVARALQAIRAAGLEHGLVIDASHGNSAKDHRRQPLVIEELAWRIGEGERGIAGVMLESFIDDGRQDLVLGRAQDLTYGQSITDACAGWASTSRMIDQLRESIVCARQLATGSFAPAALAA